MTDRKYIVEFSRIEIKRLRGRIASHIAKHLVRMEEEDASAETTLALKEWREILRKVKAAEDAPA